MTPSRACSLHRHQLPLSTPLGFYLLRLFRRRRLHPSLGLLSSLFTSVLSLLARFPRSLAPSSLLVRRPCPSPPPLQRQSTSGLRSPSAGSLKIAHFSLLQTVSALFTLIRRLLLSRLLYPCFSFPSIHHLHPTFCLLTTRLPQERRCFTRFAPRYSLFLSSLHLAMLRTLQPSVKCHAVHLYFCTLVPTNYLYLVIDVYSRVLASSRIKTGLRWLVEVSLSMPLSPHFCVSLSHYPHRL